MLHISRKYQLLQYFAIFYSKSLLFVSLSDMSWITTLRLFTVSLSKVIKEFNALNNFSMDKLYFYIVMSFLTFIFVFVILL